MYPASFDLPRLLQPPENGCALVSLCCGLRAEAVEAIAMEKNWKAGICLTCLSFRVAALHHGLLRLQWRLESVQFALYNYRPSSERWLFKEAIHGEHSRAHLCVFMKLTLISLLFSPLWHFGDKLGTISHHSLLEKSICSIDSSAELLRPNRADMQMQTLTTEFH